MPGGNGIAFAFNAGFPGRGLDRREGFGRQTLLDARGFFGVVTHEWRNAARSTVKIKARLCLPSADEYSPLHGRGPVSRSIKPLNSSAFEDFVDIQSRWALARKSVLGRRPSSSISWMCPHSPHQPCSPSSSSNSRLSPNKLTVPPVRQRDGELFHSTTCGLPR